MGKVTVWPAQKLTATMTTENRNFFQNDILGLTLGLGKSQVLTMAN